MEKRILGQTGMSVSVLGMGCWAIAGGPTWGPQDQRDSMDALQWLLGQPAVASVLVGARNPQQVHDNVAAATADPVDSLWLQRLTQVTDPLKQTLGPSLDMWQSDSRAR